MEEHIKEIFGNKLRVRVSGLLIEDDRILLVEHQSIGKQKVIWAPPGGGMSFGEPTEETLKREFLEETGLSIEVGKLLFVNEFLDRPLHAIELFFEVKSFQGELKKGYDPEMGSHQQVIQQVKFVSFEEIIGIGLEKMHSIFHKINSLSDLLNLNGYYKNVNLS